MIVATVGMRPILVVRKESLTSILFHHVQSWSSAGCQTSHRRLPHTCICALTSLGISEKGPDNRLTATQ